MGKLGISAWREGMHRLTLGVWVLTHKAWPTNKKNWNSVHSQSVLISLGSQRLNGIAFMTARMSWRLFKRKCRRMAVALSYKASPCLC